MPEPSRFIDVLVDANGDCEECALRYKMEDEPRPVRRVRTFDDAGRAIECEVVGWSSEGGGTPVPAMGCTIEDSSSGVAVLIWGGDWGLRLTPIGGGEAIAESHLRLAPEDVVG